MDVIYSSFTFLAVVEITAYTALISNTDYWSFTSVTDVSFVYYFRLLRLLDIKQGT